MDDKARSSSNYRIYPGKSSIKCTAAARRSEDPPRLRWKSSAVRFWRREGDWFHSRSFLCICWRTIDWKIAFKEFADPVFACIMQAHLIIKIKLIFKKFQPLTSRNTRCNLKYKSAPLCWRCSYPLSLLDTWKGTGEVRYLKEEFYIYGPFGRFEQKSSVNCLWVILLLQTTPQLSYPLIMR